MNEYIEIEYRKSEVQEYVIELLTLGICNLFLKGSFINSWDVLTASYQCEGYRRLDTMEWISAEDALSVVTALYMGVHQCGQYYIPDDSFEVESRYIYIRKDFSDVKVLYMPAQIGSSIAEKIADLLLHLADKCSQEGAVYLRKCSEIVREDRYGYKSVLHQLEKLRQEAYLCGIE